MGRHYKESMTYGERLLAQEFKRMFMEKKLNAENGDTVYCQLEFLTKDNKDKEILQKADFFVVSKNRLLVIEAKTWNGVTHIYTDEYKDLYYRENLFYEQLDFQIEKCTFSSDEGTHIKEIKVFNVKKINDEKNERSLKKHKKLEISAYNNPFIQVRGYSSSLREILRSCFTEYSQTIENVVVFNVAEDRRLLYNGIPFDGFQYLSKFTSLVTANEFFNWYFNIGKSKDFDVPKVKELIEKTCFYERKIDG